MYKIEWSESKSAKAVLMDLDDIDDEMDESQSTGEASKQGTANGITQSGEISETLVEGDMATWRGSDLQYSGSVHDSDSFPPLTADDFTEVPPFGL